MKVLRNGLIEMAIYFCRFRVIHVRRAFSILFRINYSRRARNSDYYLLFIYTCARSLTLSVFYIVIAEIYLSALPHAFVVVIVMADERSFLSSKSHCGS